MQKQKPDTPYKGSWAEQESKRPKVQLTEQQKAQLRSGVIHPGWEHSVTLGKTNSPRL